MYGLRVPRTKPLSEAASIVIREYTTETFVSQSELARRSGVSQPHISNVFTGKAVFTLDQLDMICTALGIQLIAVIHDADVTTRQG